MTHKNTKRDIPGTFVITQCWKNGTLTLQYGPKKIRLNIHLIKPYTFDTNVEDIYIEKCMMMSTYDHQLYTSALY